MFDVRSVANFILRRAKETNRPVSNLALNKIIYFAYVAYLERYDRPLTSAKIEAWQHGPVFREVYQQFKKFGSGPITQPATRISPVSGQAEVVAFEFEDEIAEFINKIVDPLLCLPAGRLVDMSHIRDGPWYNARYQADYANPGNAITPEMISASRGRKVTQ